MRNTQLWLIASAVVATVVVAVQSAGPISARQSFSSYLSHQHGASCQHGCVIGHNTKMKFNWVACALPEPEVIARFNNSPQDRGDQSDQSAQSVTLASPQAVSSVPLPQLSSRPLVTNTIWLNFKGGSVSGKAWNETFNFGQAYQCVPYDLDGDPDSISLTEAQAIELIWERVAEDYAPYNVNITTVTPTVRHSRMLEVMVTTGIDENGFRLPQSTSSGGLAFLDVFGDSDLSFYQPAFVYYDNLGNGIPELVAEATSHEAGHGFGLVHDGQRADGLENEYYGGYFADDWSWGPIMGSPYGQQLTQWSKGDYPGATSSQDDDAILANHLGTAVDEGNWTVVGRRGFQQYTGLVGRNNDSDDWLFPQVEEGTPFLIVDNDPDYRASMGRNLDVKVSLFDENDERIWLGDPLGPQPVQYAGPEWQRMRIEAGSVSDQVTGGYSTYGNQGRYRIWFGYQHAVERFGEAASDKWLGSEWSAENGAFLTSNGGDMGAAFWTLPNGATISRAIDLSGLLASWVVVRWRSQQAVSSDQLIVYYFDGMAWNQLETLAVDQGNGGWRFSVMSLGDYALVANSEFDFTANVSLGSRVYLDAIWVLGDSVGERAVDLRIGRESEIGEVAVSYDDASFDGASVSTVTLDANSVLSLRARDPSAEMRFHFDEVIQQVMQNN